MTGWQQHQLDRMQITCTSLQTDNNASTSSFNFFTGWMLFLMSNQQCESTEAQFTNNQKEAFNVQHDTDW